MVIQTQVTLTRKHTKIQKLPRMLLKKDHFTNNRFVNDIAKLMFLIIKLQYERINHNVLLSFANVYLLSSLTDKRHKFILYLLDQSVC